MLLDRFFVLENDPYKNTKFEKRTALITDASGNKIFEQKNVEVPASWSDNALNIVANKYFYGHGKQRESSVRDMIARVVNSICDKGYLSGQPVAEILREELTYILVNQIAAFNSPVWFNIGVPGRKQQAHACFLLDVEDNIHSILDWYRDSSLIFKSGSGTGINVSKIRANGSPLSHGGNSSGPMAFIKAADACAGAIRSGSVGRRAACMVVMNADHPDISDFIWCKVQEEAKAKALIAAGYDPGIEGDAYTTVSYQNANHSVCISDDFMKQVIDKAFDQLTTFNEIAEAAWECGDPGLQFYDTIQDWHTLSEIGPILSPNPCSEYYSLPNTACNLASINLLKFLNEDNVFDYPAFEHTVKILTTAMDILVDISEYPTEKINANVRNQRQLGLGFTNLGALLMAMGTPYDSGQGRTVAGYIANTVTSFGYLQSVKIAERYGPYSDYGITRTGMHDVLIKHRKAARDSFFRTDIWKEVIRIGEMSGVRNSQISNIAPVGTIGFMMDNVTTGIEPELALVKTKTLIGGGYMELVNPLVSRALKSLGYNTEQIGDIESYILNHGTALGSALEDKDLPVFDTALGKKRFLSPKAHIDMVAAVQPFLSGGVSKTINIPNTSTIEEIKDLYIYAWKSGLKAISVYRDGCKGSQPMNTKEKKDVVKDVMKTYTAAVINQLATEEEAAILGLVSNQQKRDMPNTRNSITHRFKIGEHKGYITAGMFEDGSLGEVFITMSKEGSTISGLMDAIASLISNSLQYGIPLQAIIDRLKYTRFEPSGFTGDSQIPSTTSVLDYISRWLEINFIFKAPVAFKQTFDTIRDSMYAGEDVIEKYCGGKYPDKVTSTTTTGYDPNVVQHTTTAAAFEGMLCGRCGSNLMRTGTCLSCPSCGSSSGCAG